MPSRRMCPTFRREGKDHYIYTRVASLRGGVQELYGTERFKRDMGQCFANRALLQRFRGRCGWGIRCRKTVEGIEAGQVLGVYTGRLSLTKKREKDTNHPYHCYLSEITVADKTMHLQLKGTGGFDGIPVECNASLINHKCKKANCTAEYVQPLGDDKPGYLLVKARRDIRPGYALSLTYQNVKSLEACRQAAEELGDGWKAVPCRCRRQRECPKGRGFLVRE